MNLTRQSPLKTGQRTAICWLVCMTFGMLAHGATRYHSASEAKSADDRTIKTMRSDPMFALVTRFEAIDGKVRVYLNTNGALENVLLPKGIGITSARVNGYVDVEKGREVWISGRDFGIKLRPFEENVPGTGFFVSRCMVCGTPPNLDSNVMAVVAIPGPKPKIAVVEPDLAAVRDVLEGRRRPIPTWRHLNWGNESRNVGANAKPFVRRSPQSGASAREPVHDRPSVVIAVLAAIVALLSGITIAAILIRRK